MISLEEQLKIERKKLKIRLEEFHKVAPTYDKLLKRCKTIENKITKIENKITDNVIKDMKVIDWKFLLDINNETSLSYNKLFDEAFKFNLMYNGYYPETMQKNLSISLKPNCTKALNKTFEGIKIIYKCLKPFNKEGYKKFGIFENVDDDDYYRGSFSLYIKNLNMCYITCNYRGKNKKLHKDITLKKALKIIQEKYYFDV